MNTKYIFVTGGVCSSLGKGITSASIGTLMKASGLKVFSMKLDPYLNVDPGTMNPFQHGEVFVTNDGSETDLDLGHYERFTDENLTNMSSVTTGKIYMEVLAKERKGDFLGGTIQIIPHITNAIKEKIYTAAKKSTADIILVEIGGTVGDIEGLPYLEAMRQVRHEIGRDNTLFVHVTLLPYLKASKELKTKPTQASVRDLRSIGIQPDIIMLRSDYNINKDIIGKISLFCDVDQDAVIPAVTAKSIYEVPLEFEKYKLAQLINKKLDMPQVEPNLQDWIELVDKIKSKPANLKIALVVKYGGLNDAYLSVIESLKIACYHNNRELDLEWIDAEKMENNDEDTWQRLKSCQGILVPGGFGIRGTNGKIMAAQYAREHKTPYFGICLGLQIMTIEYARHALKDPEITSEEFDENNEYPHKHIIHFLPGQSIHRAKGGTLRLGAYKCKLLQNTLAYQIYGQEEILERHRHRYEINNDFIKKLKNSDYQVSGLHEYADGNLVEIAELKNHPFMIGTQSHPEFLSRPLRPHPLFDAFIKASKGQ
ncbi:CTP synthase [Candidatus Peregrinibacteria bacterium RIFOXYA12_FULL_33_12]|nr:MAG: CTP synthase [Candidatus Peregrinibacteria bacterium RIFOXYA2_FULL_33_21]OGJ45544.1 MAG: CTP synthase [Candidatus Peregrinibacteria bacterium RIFOXYA12_FULL_33_12]OGJ51026.1 MAG: CTP synthase [Candidatus Peregrinibacteria bacterium RIFOXYB2_FULL_33_20]